ncbi:Pre-mRNA-splicing factor 38 [Candida viswanathii]|uniref:Pre-mRNA-splicing factor 38 n=1 Tax=Candida viswanathii TaxID=5486 RepID=A0A367YDA8_9ASCO|nr:Pre-mRNA-splicing factor 38 [Candida viswanathii]
MTEATAPYYKKQASYQDKRYTQNKSGLIEPIIRHRIQDSIFYKQHLYLTNEATILPVITQHVDFIGGTDSSNRPSVFISCLFRMLELEPSKEIITTYLTQLNFNEFKYLTALTLIYIRLVYKSEEIYTIFDPYFQDFRKLRVKLKSPVFDLMRIPRHYTISHMDEWVDELLTNERVIDLILPRLVPRMTLVERGLVTPRKYYVEHEEVKEGASDDDDDDDEYVSDSD